MTTQFPRVVLASSIRFAAVLTAVGCSRLFLRHVLRDWNLSDHIDTGELVMSELVTNAVRSTGVTDPEPKWTDIKTHHVVGVQLRVIDTSLSVEVWDRSPATPVKQAQAEDAESGRGLILVEAMSKRWGIHRPPAGGKIVWAEWDLSEPAKPAKDRPHVPHRVPSIVRAPHGQTRDMATTALVQRVLSDLRSLDSPSWP
ncbi:MULTISPECIES: ATP-binding protein [unclassified Streptomyces]|uniref:ATP-binding protein n=1 Tax=unclassified Streptomyces TaxID=2593676 RepID=UPI00081EA6F2|nr:MULTISPECIES: ATP-binding protein [unclassified Streptomyces]MYZ40263.1 ATP-binding protein [Streptomyces sp. SID4917]SCG07094.1 Anti-sigma regulatory factor (Ser/Thr protein kinase) [Streptomyces sp. MnatMP-M17]